MVDLGDDYWNLSDITRFVNDHFTEMEHFEDGCGNYKVDYRVFPPETYSDTSTSLNQAKLDALRYAFAARPDWFEEFKRTVRHGKLS